VSPLLRRAGGGRIDLGRGELAQASAGALPLVWKGKMEGLPDDHHGQTLFQQRLPPLMSTLPYGYLDIILPTLSQW